VCLYLWVRALAWQPPALGAEARERARRAVLAGVNYARDGGGAALRGCVRDAHCLHGLLASRFGCARAHPLL